MAKIPSKMVSKGQRGQAHVPLRTSPSGTSLPLTSVGFTRFLPKYSREVSPRHTCAALTLIYVTIHHSVRTWHRVTSAWIYCINRHLAQRGFGKCKMTSKKPEKKTRLCGLVLVRDKLSSLCSRGQCITNISGRWKLLSSFHLCLPPEYSDGITHSSALCRAGGIWAIQPSAGSAETKEINSFVITELRFVECFCWRLRGSSVEAESP